MKILGFPSSQKFETTSYEAICTAFLIRSKVLMKHRKQVKQKAKKNDKKLSKHESDETCREELLHLNDALQYLTRKKDKSDKECFSFVIFRR